MRRTLMPVARDVLIAAVLGLLLGTALTFLGCGPVPAPKPPTPPPATVTTAVCAEIWQSELHRTIDPGGLAGCLRDGMAGATAAQIRANVRASAEWAVVHAPPPARPPTVKGRLHVDGRTMRYADGSVFRYRGLMAFALLDLVADAKEAEAVAYMTWARSRGFSLVRVLAMNYGWMELSPGEGRAALPRLLTLAASADLYVQVVALAGTNHLDWGTRDNLKAQVQAVGALCGAANNCVLEIANEFYHATQATAVHDMTFLRQLRGLVPAAVAVALGAPEADEGPDAVAMGPGADFIVLHLSRSRDRWNRVRRVRELENVSSGSGRFVVDNEPMGCAEVAEAGRRDTDPAAFFAQGALSRVFEVGSIFHCTDCLTAKIPGPVQIECADAFLAGATLWPDQVRLRFSNTGWPDSPIKSANFTRVIRAYSATDGAKWWTVLVGLTGDPALVYQNGYRPGPTLADRGSVQVVEDIK